MQFSALFSYMLWHIELKFCIWLCFNVLQIKFECRYFAFFFQYLKELSLFLNLENRKYTVFRSFLLHALTYWGEILHMIFFVLYNRSSPSVVTLRQYLKELCIFVNLEYMYNVQFSALFSYMLWHIELKLCIWLYLDVLQISVFTLRQFWRSYPSFGT